ncbi:uncharacterized protein LOC132266427 [Cornus florida]|uniref:uncharacterized protein LOC132266427 n=1 Tax=Cornus florida TaxID=4283 RepID=UPI00289EF76D|nr:uncharacterized protein LOC132266427 [Cornus florida]
MINLKGTKSPMQVAVALEEMPLAGMYSVSFYDFQAKYHELGQEAEYGVNSVGGIKSFCLGEENSLIFSTYGSRRSSVPRLELERAEQIQTLIPPNTLEYSLCLVLCFGSVASVSV